MSQETRKKAVAYIRISSLRQIDNESPETQRSTISKYAEDKNIEIVKWFYDEAKSGKNADREQLQELLKFCLKRKEQIDHWIVYNMRRASRDIDSYSSQVKLVLRAKGITVRSATEPSVTDTKEGRFMESLLVMLGQLDNESKAEVTIDNMRSLALQGFWQHPPMMGYECVKIPNEYGKMRPSLRPNYMADKVKRVLERYSEGNISKAELTRFAMEEGLKSRYGKRLSEDSVNRMLKHPIYAGYVSDKFTDYKLVEGKHDSIISKGTFERNQALLYGNKSRKGENHFKLNKDYPLKGLLLCSNCNKKLYASAPTTGNGKRSPRYHCARNSCVGLTRSVKARKVHDDFEDMLKQIKPSEGILKLYKTILLREASNSLGGLNLQINRLRDRLSDIDSSKLKVLEKVTEGVITAEEKDQLVDSLSVQKLEKSTELRKLEEQQGIRETDIEFAINVMNNVDRQWSESSLDLQVKFQSMLFPQGLIYNSNEGKFGTSQISPLYRYIITKKDTEVPLESDLVAGLGLEPRTSWL